MKEVVAGREEKTVLRINGVGEAVIRQKIRRAYVTKLTGGGIDGKHFRSARRNSIGTLSETGVKAETFGVSKQL